ncbi:MAG TPA: 2-enoyl thioester reductase domain-containing protein [Chthoniobacterales bacterium]|jgi:trans-2-enoyl-CoA reductase|nr:2-enoyl thioester reductase domain-containing protein [Chthoniobacterales bacterium]
MEKTFKAAVYETHGNPADVLRVVDLRQPEPAANEAVVRISAAPINPADLNGIEGKYPIKAPLPAIPGMEGAGSVIEVGSAVRDLAIGTQVILPHNFGTWREIAVISAERLVSVPKEIEPLQAAMLKVNPITAWRMIHDFVSLRKGDWLIQNAANSGAGQCVIQIARELGFKTVNVVRRPELVDELRSLGGDVVLVDGENLRDEVAQATGKAPIRMALNAVGGENGLRVAKCLASDGTMVTYGAMSLQPLCIPNGMLIFKNLRFTGFWVNKWYEAATPQERAETFAPLFEMAKRGLLRTKVEKTYSLSDAQIAISQASQSKRSGKIVFTF